MLSFSYVRRKYPGVLLLGCVSFFADIASEMLYPITPIFMTTILGSSMMNVGVIEGIAEGFSSLLKTFSGSWSDKISRRKPFILFGYLLSAISRPLIGFSTISLHVLGARSLDRIGKGFRDAPRDALISDLVEPKERGLAFGWHRSMDTFGAMLGPLLALVLLKYFTDLRQIYYYAIIPGLLSVSFITFIKEPKHHVNDIPSKKVEFKWASLNREYKVFVLGWTIFCLTNSSDVFLILKTKEAGLDFTTIILLYVLYNFIYASLSPFFGQLSDKFGPRKILLGGLIIFTCVYIGFAFSHQSYQFALLFLLYGIYMAATVGISKAFISNLVTTEHVGSAFGFFGMFTGFAQIFASITAGFIWDSYGSKMALLFSCTGSFFLVLILLFSFRKV